MNSIQRRITSVIALLLIFTTVQFYIVASFAALEQISTASPVSIQMPQQTGVLTTQGNKPVMVNGTAAISGTTIVTGESIETPDGVSGTINLGTLGWVKIDPNTKLTLDFHGVTMEFPNGNIRVTLLQGCVSLHTKRGTSGEISNPQGTVGKSDAVKDGVVNSCTPGSLPVVVAGAAGAGGLFGLGTAATVAIVAGGITAVVVPIATHGSNPSPSAP